MGLRAFLHRVTAPKEETNEQTIEFSVENNGVGFHYSGPAIPADYLRELRAAAGIDSKPRPGVAPIGFRPDVADAVGSVADCADEGDEPAAAGFSKQHFRRPGLADHVHKMGPR